MDCCKIIHRRSKRCKSCARKGELGPNFKHGNTLKKKYCVDCVQELSSYLAKRCCKCANTGKNNPGYIDSRSTAKYVCIDCGAPIYSATGLRGGKRCCTCAKKGENHPNFNKKRPELSRAMCGKGNPMFGKISHGRKGKYRGTWMRISWEVAYARYCTTSKIKYRYEYKTFQVTYTLDNKIVDGTYTPDFYLPDLNKFIEIKGFWRPIALLKFNAFKQTYRDVHIEVLNKKELEELGINLKYVRKPVDNGVLNK